MNLLEHKRADSPEQRWIFSREELQHLPSIRDGMRAEEEMEGRRKASEFIHKMSEILNRHRQDNSKGKISKLCMSVAMAHLHRFFCIHSMRVFDPVDIAAACLFLASKSEECCRKLADFAQAWWEAKGRDPQKMLEPRQLEEGGAYMGLLEGFVLQTVGFSLHIEIPHSIVLRTVNTHEQIRLKNAHKIGSIAYEFCTFALEKMNWFVRYRVRTIAMVCLALAWSWSPDSEAEKLSSSTAGGAEGGATNEESDVRPWYMSMEPNVSEELLSELTDELIVTRDRLRQEDTSQKKPLNHNPIITAREDAGGNTAGPNVEQSQQKPTLERAASNRQDRPLGPATREVKVEIQVEEVLSEEAGTPPIGAQQKSQRKLALSEYLWRKKEGKPIPNFLTANVIRSGHSLAAVTTTPLDVNMDANAPCEPRNNNAQFSSPSSTASSSVTATGSVDGKLVTDQSNTVKNSPPQRRSFIPTATLGDLSGRSIPEMSLELPAGIELLEQKPPAKNRTQPGEDHNPPSGSCSPSNRKQPHNRHAHGGDGERRSKNHLAHESRNTSKDWNSPSKRSSPEKNRQQPSSHRDEHRRTHHRPVRPAGDEQLRPSHHRQHHGSEESLRRKISSSSHGVTTSTLEHPHARPQQHRNRSHQRYSDLDGTPTGGDADVAAWSQASASSGRLSNRTSVRRDPSVYDSQTKRWRGEEGDSISGNPPLPPDDPHDLQQPLPPSPPIPGPPPPDFTDELEEGELR